MVKPLSQMWLDKLYNGQMVPCKVIHDHSCNWQGFLKWWHVFSMAFKFYIPIHLIPSLIFKMDKFKKDPKMYIKRCLKNTVMSSMFISAYVGGFWYLCCVFRNLRMSGDKMCLVFSGLICSMAVFFEPPSRRTELALYMFPRFLESFFMFLQKKGLVKSIPNGEVLVFALALSIIMYC